MTLAAFAGNHARSILCVAGACTLAGIAAALGLPVGLFPQTSFPRVLVQVDAGSRPADQMARLVTRPVEEAVRAVPGVRDVRSATNRGAAAISIDFGWGRDMAASTVMVQAAIAQILPDLPQGAAYTVKRMDPTAYPIISYALQSNAPSAGSALPGALRDLAQFQIVPLLSAIPGLAHVDVQGGDTAEIEVLADPHVLALHGLALTDLATALAAGNTLQAVGQMQDRARLFLLLAGHVLRTRQDVADLVIRATPAGILRLHDVATVEDGTAPRTTSMTEDGRPAVLFNIYQQPAANALQIGRDVRAKLATLALPAGVRLITWYDQGELVAASAASVRDAVLIGLVLAAIVLVVFLRSLRVTLVALIVVPATLAIACLVLSALGESFNIMTLGGIAAAVGLLIDDVIVMVEHIARRAGVAGQGRDAVLPAAVEFFRPLTGSSLATLIVFLPLGFLTGVTGAFSKALSLTMAACLAVSYLMTAFAVPLLTRRFVDFTTWRDPAARRPGWLGRRHGALLAILARRPLLLAAALLPILALGVIAATQVPTGFMPHVDEGGFVLDYYAKPGTSLIETDRQARQIDAIIAAMPEVATFSRRLGAGLGGDLFEAYHGDVFVRLKPGHARSTDAVMQTVRQQIAQRVPGMEVELAQLMEDRIGDLTAVPQPIEIKIYNPDPAPLIDQARKAAAAIAKIGGVVEVKDGVNLAGDAFDIRIDPIRASVEGVTADDVTQALSGAIAGIVATQVPLPAKSVGVRVRLPDARSLRLDDLAAVPIRAADGHIFPLGRVATLAPVTGQPEIARDNLQPMIAVTGRIEGRGIGAAIADVRKAMDQPGMLAPGMRYELGGLYQQQQIAFAGLARVFAAALAAEFVLLLFLYERLWLPVIIIACALLSTTAVFAALWATGVALNITALMGMTMIIGIGTEMAIFYVSEYTDLARLHPARAALRLASANRLRPITMTTLAAILTLLPLALAIGPAAGIQQPLAIAIIAGLLLQYPLVLLAMPVLIGLTLGKDADTARVPPSSPH